VGAKRTKRKTRLSGRAGRTNGFPLLAPAPCGELFFLYSGMIRFKALLEKFDAKGEKTGWTYVAVPEKIAQQLKPGNKRSFRVKGKIDEHPIKAVAMVPMGEGNFIIAVNAIMRKAIRKIHGAKVIMELEEDKATLKISEDLSTCLKDDPGALKYFNALPQSHRNWYSNWVKSAKTDMTRSKRIATVIRGCTQQLNFREMLKQYREERLF